MFKKLIASLFVLLSFGAVAAEHRYDHTFSVLMYESGIEQVKFSLKINGEIYYVEHENMNTDYYYTFPVEIANFAEETGITVLWSEYYDPKTKRYYKNILNNNPACSTYSTADHAVELYRDLNHETNTIMTLYPQLCAGIKISAIHE